jgi:hypothetical protein
MCTLCVCVCVCVCAHVHVCSVCASVENKCTKLIPHLVILKLQITFSIFLTNIHLYFLLPMVVRQTNNDQCETGKNACEQKCFTFFLNYG